MLMGTYDFGMIGLGVMGSNLLLNMADHGFSVVGYDKNIEKIKLLEDSAKENTEVKGVNTLAEMVNLLKRPRKLMMLVPAGNPVDSVISELIPLLQEGDIVIDGGNSHYTDTLKRIMLLKEKQFHFMGVGISGGEEGARSGPSIMPGGDMHAYKEVEPILKSVAAKVDGEPCVGYLGNDAAGHFVKMVHNGIEYAIMELISECYQLLHEGLQLGNTELSQVFGKWNKGEMRSFLLEITADIFLQKDDKTQNSLVDMILDKAGAKGTGKWTSEAALEIGEPIPVIDAAVTMRNISSLKEERISANKLYGKPENKLAATTEKFIDELKSGLYFATVISYAQGLSLLSKASIELNMNIPMEEVLRVWSGGCIIRTELLKTFKKVFAKDAAIKNMLLDADIAELLKNKYHSIKNVIVTATNADFPITAFSSAINYYNAYRSERLPANLIQAQRDYFGAHTYERTDKEGFFHTTWLKQ